VDQSFYKLYDQNINLKDRFIFGFCHIFIRITTILCISSNISRTLDLLLHVEVPKVQTPADIDANKPA
jgi:hypothetical protein